MISLRKALPQDAAEICQVLRQSITTLCEADHHNDPAVLARWLGNKTPEMMTSWIEDPASTMIVVCDEAKLLAVGSVMQDGEIALNYVLPKARFQGISRKLISALEDIARGQGNKTTHLSSTGTARRFYLAMGYQSQDARTGFFGTQVYPMTKVL